MRHIEFIFGRRYILTDWNWRHGWRFWSTFFWFGSVQLNNLAEW